jgi:hypothetical protein
METAACAYLRAHDWCTEITRIDLAWGVGRVIAVFRARFAQKIWGTDDELWIVVGDVPSAYLVVDDLDDAAEVLKTYCDLMEEWATSVQSGKGGAGCFPVQAEPTVEHARMLLSRIRTIRSSLVPAAEHAAKGT